MRVDALIGKWTWLSDYFQRDLALSKSQFQVAIRRGSIRIDQVLVLGDLFIGPGARLVAYLDPKTYHAQVDLIPTIIPNGWHGKWRPRWHLLRKISPRYFVIDKPAGIASVLTKDHPRSALTPFWLRMNLPRSLSMGNILGTSRLDVGTHGLIVIGRSSDYVARYNALVSSRKVTKKYTAVVQGWFSTPNPCPTSPLGNFNIIPSQDQLDIHFNEMEIEFEKKKLDEHDRNRLEDERRFLTKDHFLKFNQNGFLSSRRHLGRWIHWFEDRMKQGKRSNISNLRSLEKISTFQGNDPLPPRLSLALGEFTMSSEMNKNDWDHLRVLAERQPSSTHIIPVELIVERVRLASADSVSLRPFHPQWVESIIASSLEEGDPLVEIDIELITGKTHQIRAQLKAEGLTIIGDWLYGSNHQPMANTFALCCRKLSWLCPDEKYIVDIDLSPEPKTEASQIQDNRMLL